MITFKSITWNSAPITRCVVVKSQILETEAGFYTHSVVYKLGGSKEVA